MVSYSLSQLSHLVGGRLIGDGSRRISRLLIDSRSYFTPGETLFFALPGVRHDGHDYIADLYARGVRAFVVSKTGGMSPEQFPDAGFVAVDDTLKALQMLAAQHRSTFTGPVVAITGSNGKTILKEWIYQAMHQEKKILRSPKSYNSQVGVPLSVWPLSEAYDMAVFEAGISQPGEMERLEAILRPDVCILTHIGGAHQEHFSDIAQKVDEKFRLFARCRTLICRAGVPSIEAALERWSGRQNVRLLQWKSFDRENDVLPDEPAAIRVVKNDGEGRCWTVHYHQTSFDVRLPFTDPGSMENAMHLVALMLYNGYDGACIAQRVASLTSIAMRLEMKTGIHGCTLINDSYNADVESLAIALDVLGRQHQHARHTLILSDILQTGQTDDALYGGIARMVRDASVDRVIGIGPALSSHASLFRPQDTFFASVADFMEHVRQLDFHNEAILIKGARRYAFERIVALLEGKLHETVLEVDLNAMIHNYNYFKSLLHHDTKMVVMTKAATYGAGTYEIASLLQYHRVDYLATAFVDEGVSLRENGITVPIIVMNPEPPSLHAMIGHHLEPVVYNIQAMQHLSDIIADEGLRDYPVHVKLDTGMHRMGFQPQDVADVVAFFRNCPYLKVQSAFSHLAGSDEPALDDFTRQQLAAFERMTSQLQAGIGYRFLRHILNSAGIERFPEFQFDMVRLGIGLHGFSAVGNTTLKPVVTLKSVISQIKDIAPGESVGYGRKFMAASPTRYGVVPIGYADGLRRMLGNGRGYMTVRGQRAPIIGNVCMDMCMLDLTGLDAEEGDEVIVIGTHPSAQEIADMLQTIPYEVLTDISPRVKRVYYQE